MIRKLAFSIVLVLLVIGGLVGGLKVSKKEAPALTGQEVQQLRRGVGYGLLKAMSAAEKRRAEWKQDKPGFLKNISEAGGKAKDSLDFIIMLQDKGLQLGRHVVQSGSKRDGKEWLVAVAPHGQEIPLEKMMRPDLLDDLKERQKGGLIISASDEIRYDLRETERKAEEARRSADYEERKRIKDLYWFTKAHGIKSQKAVSMYSSGGMASQQASALQHHKDVIKVREQLEEREQRAQQNAIRAMLIEQEREDAKNKKGRKRDQGGVKEMTDAKREKTQDQIMKELFDKRFSAGNNVREAMEKERVRDR